MRKRKRKSRLNLATSHRSAMLRNMVTSLFEHERITTTHPRAKEVSKLAERIITLGKKGDLAARRRADAVVRRREVTSKVFAEIAPRFSSVNGGYTRVIKAGFRPGDGAPMAVVELVKPD